MERPALTVRSEAAGETRFEIAQAWRGRHHTVSPLVMRFYGSKTMHGV